MIIKSSQCKNRVGEIWGKEAKCCELPGLRTSFQLQAEKIDPRGLLVGRIA